MNLKDHDFAILSLFKEPEPGKGEQLFHLVETYNKRIEQLTETMDTDFEKTGKVAKVLCKLRGPVFFNTKYDDSAIARIYGYTLDQIESLKRLVEKTKTLYKRMKYAYECKVHRSGGVLEKPAKGNKGKGKPPKRTHYKPPPRDQDRKEDSG